MHRFAQDGNEVDLEELRDRLHKMSEQQLRPFGEATKFTCSERANGKQPPRKHFLFQLEEAKEAKS
jgi:hypothetical protein